MITGPALLVTGIILFIMVRFKILSKYKLAKIVAKAKVFFSIFAAIVTVLGGIMAFSAYHLLRFWRFDSLICYNADDINWFWKILDIKVQYCFSHLYDSVWVLLWLAITVAGAIFAQLKIATDRRKRNHWFFTAPIFFIGVGVSLSGGVLYGLISSAILWGLVWLATWAYDEVITD